MSDNRTVNDQDRQDKKAQFSAPQPKNKKASIGVIIVLVALAGIAAYVVMTSLKSDSGSPSVAATESGDIRIPVADLKNGIAKFFNYTSRASNKNVRFFVMRSSDGVYRAALDACDVCYHSKKGYKQDGDDMVCQNCGLRFHSTLINQAAGGCNPIGIDRAIEGEYVVIKARDLESRTTFF